MISTGKIYLENYTRKIVTKAKMREISKKFFHAGGRQHFSSKCESLPQNAGDLIGLK